MKLQFLGANRQVTGSRYFLEAGGLRLLIDCGLFQEREFQSRNWEASPISPDGIDFLLLTHAHLDHSGLIPKFVREGFKGSILTNKASARLARIILSDAAKIQMEDVAFKKKRHERAGHTSSHPYTPLYTTEDVEQAMPLFKGISYNEPIALNDNVTVCYHDAGHILGSAMLELNVRENGATRRFICSGDIGQWKKPLVRDPSVFEQADYVIMESTYGDRNHEANGDVETQLCRIINETEAAGGNIVIPVFAVERAQELMFYLGRLVQQDKIPHLMAFLDSPMAVSVTEVFQGFTDYLDEDAQAFLRTDQNLFDFPRMKMVRSTEESKAINHIKGTCIIMAGSGMCTGGRIKHHLVQNISRPQSTILFVGFQAHGTLGRQIVDGNSEVRILGQRYPVRARIAQIHGFSAHADQQGLLYWLNHFKSPPRHLFLVHGEEEAALTLAKQIEVQWTWEVSAPEYKQTWDLE